MVKVVRKAWVVFWVSLFVYGTGLIPGWLFLVISFTCAIIDFIWDDTLPTWLRKPGVKYESDLIQERNANERQ